jgi:hypothetical protein
MNALTADFLVNLAAELSGALIPALVRRLRAGLVTLTMQPQKDIGVKQSRPIFTHRWQGA